MTLSVDTLWTLSRERPNSPAAKTYMWSTTEAPARRTAAIHTTHRLRLSYRRHVARQGAAGLLILRW